MQMASHIQELLFKHSCIVVPGFGAFMAHTAPAALPLHHDGDGDEDEDRPEKQDLPGRIVPRQHLRQGICQPENPVRNQYTDDAFDLIGSAGRTVHRGGFASG